MNTYIKHISYYLPERKLGNDKLNELFPEWSADKISRKTGIYNRHIAENNESTSDMAVKASENLINEYSIDRSTIDFVLLCTQSPDYFLPTTACLVQDKLGLSTSCGALDFNLGCSGYVYGLGIAKGLLMSEQASNILLITSESYSKYLHPKDKSNRTIFGDGASASLITRDEDIGNYGEIGTFVHGTDGSGGPSLIVKNGGSKSPKSKEEDNTNEYGNVTSDNHLFMDGGDVFNFTIKAVPNLISELLNKANLELDDIDLYVFHQANKFMLNHLRKKIGIDKEVFFIHLENCGNTVSSTIPIALREAKEQGKIVKGSKILLAGFGVGLSWSGTILEV